VGRNKRQNPEESKDRGFAGEKHGYAAEDSLLLTQRDINPKYPERDPYPY